MRDRRDDLERLGQELEPTPAQIDELIGGSLENQRDAPPAYALLRELPSPLPGEVRELERAVASALDRDPPAVRERRMWIRRAAVAGVLLVLLGGALAWLI